VYIKIVGCELRNSWMNVIWSQEMTKHWLRRVENSLLDKRTSIRFSDMDGYELKLLAWPCKELKDGS
jgi:hypothetical protein